MDNTEKYYVVKQKAIPEVLLKVVGAKRLLASGKAETVGQATQAMGISRSSFYKYQDDIFPFHDNSRGRTVTFSIQLDDEPGLLAEVLQTVAKFHANILTIHQSVPVGGIAALSLSIEVLPTTENISVMVETLETLSGIHHVKLLSME